MLIHQLNPHDQELRNSAEHTAIIIAVVLNMLRQLDSLERTGELNHTERNHIATTRGILYDQLGSLILSKSVSDIPF